MLFGRLRCSQKGQAVVELGLSLPLLLLLSLGAVEISNMINTYLVLTHLTREGANLTSRGGGNTEADIQKSLDAIIAAAKPVICEDGVGCRENDGQWTVIFSLIGPDPDNAGVYIIVDQIEKGGLGKGSRIGSEGDTVTSAEIPKIDEVARGLTFNVIEAFYTYGTITPLDNFLGSALPKDFYVRTIFTNVGGG